jgi:hypothetical protein
MPTTPEPLGLTPTMVAILQLATTAAVGLGCVSLQFFAAGAHGVLGVALVWWGGLLFVACGATALWLWRCLRRGRGELLASHARGVLRGLLVLVLAAALYETTARGRQPPPSPPAPAPLEGFLRHDPWLGWAGRSNAGQQLTFGDVSLWVRNDGRGFEDPGGEEGLGPDARACVVLIGDSMACGYGVEQAEAPIVHLRSKLDLCRVHLRAVRGHGPDQILLNYTCNVRPMRPALVVLLLMLTPGHDRSRPLEFGLCKPYYVLRAGRPELRGTPVPHFATAAENLVWSARRETVDWPGPIESTIHLLRDWLPERTHLGQQAVGAWRNFWLPRRGFPEPRRITLALLAQLREEVAGDGADLVVAIAPPAGVLALPDRVRVWQAVLKPVRHVLGEVVDLLPVLDAGHERQEGGHWLYTRDNHPDERGYRRIGRHLAEVVAARLR